jgi:hypothetical protein
MLQLHPQHQLYPLYLLLQLHPELLLSQQFLQNLKHPLNR